MLDECHAIAKQLLQNGRFDDAVRMAALGLVHFESDESPADEMFSLAVDLEQIITSHNRIHSSISPFQTSIFEKNVEETIGIKPGETNERKILQRDYPALTRYVQKDLDQMEYDFVLIGANPQKTRQLRSIYAGKGPVIAKDIAQFGSHIHSTIVAQKINYIVSFERDMDTMSTGFEGMGLPNIRSIITTEKLGGKNPDSVYSQIVKIMEAIPFTSEMRQVGPIRHGIFQQMVKNRIRDHYGQNYNHRLFMDLVYQNNIIQALPEDNSTLDGKSVLFADIGFKGTIPYFSAAMLEQSHTNAKAYVCLYYSFGSGENSDVPFAKFVPRFTSDESSFKRHNSEKIQRLLVGRGDPSGKRTIRRVQEQDDLHDLFEVCLRHHYAAQAKDYVSQLN